MILPVFYMIRNGVVFYKRFSLFFLLYEKRFVGITFHLIVYDDTIIFLVLNYNFLNGLHNYSLLQLKYITLFSFCQKRLVIDIYFKLIPCILPVSPNHETRIYFIP